MINISRIEEKWHKPFASSVDWEDYRRWRKKTAESEKRAASFQQMKDALTLGSVKLPEPSDLLFDLGRYGDMTGFKTVCFGDGPRYSFKKPVDAPKDFK